MPFKTEGDLGKIVTLVTEMLPLIELREKWVSPLKKTACLI